MTSSLRIDCTPRTAKVRGASHVTIIMAPAKRRKLRPSTNKSLDFLNNLSKAGSTKGKHTSRHDSVYDIPSSPESPRLSQKNKPVRQQRRPRTRQTKGTSTPSPEPDEFPEPDREPETIEAEPIHSLSPDVADYEDAEELMIHSEGAEELQEQLNDSLTKRTEDGEQRSSSAVDVSDDNQNEFEVEDMGKETDEGPEQESAEHIDDNTSPQPEDHHQLVPSRNNVEVVIENTQHSYLSHGFAETILESDDNRDPEPREQPVKQKQKHQKRINPNTQFLRDLRQRFDQEVQNTGVDSDWKKLNEQGRSLKHYASRPRPNYLENLHLLFDEYRRLYREISRPDDLSSDLWARLRNVKESIVTEVRQLFEHASEVLQDSSVIDQFEAHFIPKMVILPQLGFIVYRATDGQAYDQLYQTLDLLSICIKLVKGYIGLLEPQFRSRSLGQPLNRVSKALKAGQLRAKHPDETGPFWSDIAPVTERWTSDEERVLRYGMIEYVEYGQSRPTTLFLKNSLMNQVDNPFLQIATHWGHKLPRRSMRDMEGKAKAMGLS
ncbi:uncharacterized protein N7469_009814 [Penicillium citrinum]|uniref:Uncharacterized protein n=1 Tax=Penicillium citrinum TaxID=5077 RepID=A0A9W9NJ57_PENCI|nr:uncharacterized protein N7469_009814 [Penicillium citrinum]KAJ5220927.1 hypothetical protein N7469_009814 [Penicillium citrinum]